MRYVLIILIFLKTLSSCNGQETRIVYQKSEGADCFKYVKCAYWDKKGSLWIGTKNDGLFRYEHGSFKQYTKHDALCNNTINCIAEDNKGVLWIGTADGLCTYDRKVFSHIPIPRGDTSGVWLDKVYPIVNPNEVQAVLPGKDGRVWIGTNGAGAYSYDGKTFTNYLQNIGRKQADSMYHNIIQSITRDKAGNIWFTSMTHGGVSRYNGIDFTHYSIEDGLSDDMTRVTYVDNTGNLWIGFNGNRKSMLTKYDGSLFMSVLDSGISTSCGRNVRCIYKDKLGKLWLGGKTLCIYDDKTKTLRQFKTDSGISFSQIQFIIGVEDGNIMFGGTDGIWIFDGRVVREFCQ